MRCPIFFAVAVLLLVPSVAGAVPFETWLERSVWRPAGVSVQNLEDDLDLFLAGTPQTLVLGEVTFDPDATTVEAGTFFLSISDVWILGFPFALEPYSITHSVRYVRDASGNALGLDPAGEPIFVDLANFLGPGRGLLLEALPTADVTGPVTVPPDGAPLVAPVRFQVTMLPVPEASTALLILLSLGILGAARRL